MQTLSSPNPAVALQSELLASTQDANNVLSAAHVAPIFQGHYFNMETGEHGIASLILAILEANGACFEEQIGTSAMRQIAIAGSMFSADIIAAVQAKFSDGTTRYPAATIAHNLSTVCGNGPTASKRFKGSIGKIRLTKAEDQESCKKGLRPRTVYFKVSPVPTV